MENTELKNAFGRLKEGNTEAFEEIYNSLKKPVYTVILRYLGVKEDAEDVTQEVFLKLFRAPPGEEVKNIRAYIFASARNAAMDKLRERASEGEKEELTDTLPYGEDDAAERMEKAAQLARLRYAEGYSPYLDVLEAERTLYSTQIQLANRRAAQLAAIAQVCVALGGGW